MAEHVHTLERQNPSRGAPVAVERLRRMQQCHLSSQTLRRQRNFLSAGWDKDLYRGARDYALHARDSARIILVSTETDIPLPVHV